jgi:hypothetical protein
MKVRAAILVMLLGLYGSAPAFAQNAIGGPTKQRSLGGAVRQSSPVIPASKVGSTPVTAPSKVGSIPAGPPPKVGSIAVTPPPQVKCQAPPCVAKESHH